MSATSLALRRAPALLRERGSRWLQRGERNWATAVAPHLVEAAAPTDGSGWSTRAVVLTSTNVSVVTVTSTLSPRRFVVKLPATSQSDEALRRHIERLASLRGDLRLQCLHQVLPQVVAQGEIDRRFYCVEEALPGTPASRILARRHRQAPLIAAAAQAIGELHQRTSSQTRVDDNAIEAWVREPLRRLSAYAATRPGSGRLLDSLDRVGDELLGALADRIVRTSWIHGDFWPGNLLTGPAGTDVTGVVDWDRAGAGQLPLHDLLHLHVLSRRLAYGGELGDVVVHALHGGLESALGAPAGEVATWLDGIPQRPAVLLYWLRHIRLFIDSEGHHGNRRWLRGNLDRVLISL